VTSKRRREERPITAGPRDRAPYFDSDDVAPLERDLDHVPIDVALQHLSRRR
jgi:hypothetical protein